MKRPTKTRFALAFSVFTMVPLGCAQGRYATTNLGQMIDNPVTVAAPWGEVFCGRGTICAEVEVLRLDAEDREGGEVAVLLHNRTGAARAVQVGLELLDPSGVAVDTTNFEDLALEARQERRFTMPGFYRPGHKVRVVLRQRAS
ncbi:MAG: hypothetical protein ACO3JL_08520 [Myxococcota bacterium]